MSRDRVAIAHFPSSAAALRTRMALVAQGGAPRAFLAEADGPCYLEVTLPQPLERRLLDILLGSDATLVDVHDA